MLPPIQVSLPIIFILWCILGVWAHGWVMLAYPAMWAVVGGIFLVFNFVLKSRSEGNNASGTAG